MKEFVFFRRKIYYQMDLVKAASLDMALQHLSDDLVFAGCEKHYECDLSTIVTEDGVEVFNNGNFEITREEAELLNYVKTGYVAQNIPDDGMAKLRDLFQRIEEYSKKRGK